MGQNPDARRGARTAASRVSAIVVILFAPSPSALGRVQRLAPENPAILARHRGLGGGTGYFAWQLVQGLNARINYLRAMTIFRPNRSLDAHAEMLRIVEAIARKDGQAAAKAGFDRVETVNNRAIVMLGTVE